MKIIIIGSSTGGPYILESILSKFPVLPIAIILVQHLPPAFTKPFTAHIAALTQMNVVTANSEEKITENSIYIAQSGYHLLITNNRVFTLSEDVKVHGVRPAVDRTMLTIKKRAGDEIMGIILSGMGRDGAEGMDYLHQIGGVTIAQDPATSPIKSMPQAAIETGHVDFVLTPEQIREKMISFGGSKFLMRNHKQFNTDKTISCTDNSKGMIL